MSDITIQTIENNNGAIGFPFELHSGDTVLCAQRTLEAAEMVKKKMLATHEASVIAERINLNRFEGVMPSSDDTVRLTELLDILVSMEQAA